MSGAELHGPLALRRLELRRAPGAQDPLTLDGFAAGVTVLHGPNESGKTTIARALRALLWPGAGEASEYDLRAEFEVDGRELVGELLLGVATWRLDGAACAAPGVPPDDLASCYSMGADELLRGSADASDLPARVGRALAGGYDLDAVRESLAASDRAGQGAVRSHNSARHAVEELRLAQRRLAADAAGLDALRLELEAARGRAADLPLWVHAEQLAKCRADLAAAATELERYPAELEGLQGDEPRRLEELDARVAAARERAGEAQARCEAARRRLDDAGLADGPLDLDVLQARSEDLEELRARERHLAELEEQRASAARALEEDVGAPDETLEWSPDDARALADLGGRLERHAGETRGAQRAFELVDRAAADLVDHGARAPERAFRCARGAAWAGALALLVVAAVAWSRGDRELSLGSALGALLVALYVFVGGRREDGYDETPRVLAKLEAEQELLQRQGEALERERASLRERTGLDASLATADLARTLWMRREVREYDLAIEHAAGRVRALSEPLAAFVAPFVAAPVPPEGRALSAALERLRERSRATRGAQETLAAATGDVERARAEEAQARAQRSELFARAGLEDGDRATLARRVGDLKGWRAARDKLQALEARIAQLRAEDARLDGLGALAPEDLEQRLREARAAEAERAELNDRIVQIETRIGEAQKGVAMESALGALANARERVREETEAYLDRRAATLLLDTVEAELEGGARVDVLETANRLFSRFTERRHALRFSRSSGRPTFRALDSQRGRELELSELSAGTRMQLLLAARVAFATEEASRAGVRPPLVFDEVLAHTDGERGAAFVEVLTGLASEAWQVLYFSTDPGDVERFRAGRGAGDAPAFASLDLARLRGLGRRVSDPRELATPARPVVPDPSGPAGARPEDYGAAIGAERFDPREPPGRCHVFHLLRDDLPTLAEVLRLRLPSVGRLEQYLKPGARGSGLLDARRRTELQARVRLLHAFVQHWRVGRGRPVELERLRDAGVKPARLEAVARAARDVGLDARRLLETLSAREGDLARYRENHIERHAVRFREFGWIDDRPQLDATAILHACLEHAAGALREGVLERAQVERLVDEWWHQAQRALQD